MAIVPDGGVVPTMWTVVVVVVVVAVVVGEIRRIVVAIGVATAAAL